MNKEEYQLKQQIKREGKDKERQKRKIKKVARLTFLILAGGGVVFAGGWYLWQNSSGAPQSEIISRQGIHWHPSIEISILGKAQEIPAGIGLSVVHNPIHTHETDGVIHLEFQGLVRADDIRLGNFFKVWGKQFNNDCIFEYCSGEGKNLKMFVNGQENFEFENYIMKDGDKIEIIYGPN